MKITPIEESLIGEFKNEWLETSDSAVRWNPKIYFFGLFEGHELLGYIKFTINGGVGHLHDIIVKKEFRGRKNGRVLMEFFIRFCRENGCHKATLTTSEAHKGAIKFHEHMGFKKESEMKDDKFHHNWCTYYMKLD